MRRCMTFFYRSSSLVVLLAMGLWSSSQIALADSFCWQGVNGQNWDTPVESQFGGTCWDFSACGTLEAKYKLTRNDPTYNRRCFRAGGLLGAIHGQHGWRLGPQMS